MDSILQDLPFVFCYVDDILIGPVDEQKHSDHIRRVFQHEVFHIHIKLSKCIFGASEVPFLGFLVSAKGVLPIPDHVTTIIGCTFSKRVTELSRFLVMINFYRCYTEGIHAFEDLKSSLSNAELLKHPSIDAALLLMVDASDCAIHHYIILHYIRYNKACPNL
ncbi:hypothetical protein PR048_019498 [Dryococelus australis]|uniref:Reverse transcriptase domain-containing protein n=1 Tax=Dryococelus australis TaxID=614101 RepID=A0ABQ9H3M2_9NEOP|nr:hypothetical protein PR048_019498 [Dryococelus australis]